MKYSVLNFILFQVAWFGCALGMGNALPEVTYTVLFTVISLHFGFSHNRKRDARYLVIIALMGTAVDSTLGGFGVLDFRGHWLCPLWLTGLWMTFATTIHYSLSWLKERLILGSILGAAGGPASYYAGAQFGALQIGPDTVANLMILALIWSVLVPLMLYLAKDQRSINCLQKLSPPSI